MTTPERPENDTLRLLRETVDDIAANPAVASGEPVFSVTMHVVPSQTWSVREPGRRDLRDLLQLLRHLDMPTSDIRLDRVYPMLERSAVPDWQGAIADARRAYVDGQEPDWNLVQDPDDRPVLEGEDRTPRWIRPREAWDLWAYGEVIHQEYRKQLRWERLGPLPQAAVRLMAHEYTMMLLAQAAFIHGLLRFGVEGSQDDAEPQP
jgi:hypothetical protein